MNLFPKRVARATNTGWAADRASPVPIVIWCFPCKPFIPILQFHPGSRLVVETRIPSVSPAYTTSNSLTKRFPRPITLASLLTKADKQRRRDGSGDEEDKADGQADFFAEVLTARRGGRRLGVRGVGTRGGEQGEGGAAENFGIATIHVHYEGEGEVGGWLVAEPGGAHVEEDGSFIVDGVEGCECVCGGWRGEAAGVDVVDLYGVVYVVFEEGGIPGHCEVLAFALNRSSDLKFLP